MPQLQVTENATITNNIKCHNYKLQKMPQSQVTVTDQPVIQRGKGTITERERERGAH